MWTPSSAGDWLALALAGVASASVIAGFAIIGGPGKARDMQQDDVRLQALLETAEGLNCFSRGVGPLPEDMDTVRLAIADSGSQARLAAGCSNADWKDDPITGAPFEIHPIDEQHAQICAVFARPGSGQERGFYLAIPASYVDYATPRPKAGLFCYTVNLVASPD